MSHADSPTKLSEHIEKVITNLGQRRNYLGWKVVQEWPEIVGERIARISQAERFDDGSLFVRVEKEAWRQSLSQEQELLLGAIARAVGEGIVRRIHFR